ncbi:claudin-12-like [Hyla sarda]|uniref:claudin-12-like n=1 Tax=Hyla sarda TaxID=327740 RepID=UPI0024C403B2|nr:claudin-12-like [Hyla sarda]
MGCQEVHAVTLLAFVCGTSSVSGLFAAVLLPQWRLMKLYTFNRNEKNLTVSMGLWVKCTRLEWSRDCMIYDTAWFANVDQLDIRVLQFALPFSILTAATALILCLIGICNTTFNSNIPSLKIAKCLVNSAGCHLVAGVLFCLAGAMSLTPSAWVIFYNNILNSRYGPYFTYDIAVFVAIGSAGGMFFTAALLFAWYCNCKSSSSAYWQPLYSHIPNMANYIPPSYSSQSPLSAIDIDFPVTYTV